MNDPSRSPQDRETAALAYRAGMMRREAEQPLITVFRAFAQRADAMAAAGGSGSGLS
jgi:hypothetical protein